jgi:hypothetical protein
MASLSTSACDFRGFTPGSGWTSDPSGANYPMAWGGGFYPNIQFILSGMTGASAKLVPGQTYYLNLRNAYYGTGQVSCTTASCNVRITVNTPR